VQQQAAELAVGRRWAFGPAVLDESSLELTVDGEPAKLERKPLEVLLYLLHHAGEVVTKDELADNLWPGRILTESVLTRCISQLRQVLRDNERSVIRTVYGYGYRLVAEVKIDAVAEPAPQAFSFQAGDRPPLRPHWRLVERLGAGGHGEAWLAEQEKTRDHRVFKFAVDAGGLAALKREITLYRLLNDTLGDGAPVVRLLEWNLEEAPYFIETEYIEGRDLHAWSETNGGLASMAFERRLDLVAQIAEAVAKAHSVGALHKDLKPSNVLVHGGDTPLIKLCDFGSGGVLDALRLERLGITRLGFTKTSADATSATPLYVAPEVIAGQPSTVAADIYALGVILYQVIVGDLRKALAPGWELDVADELLREDIAAAAAGDPSRRLADAAQVAERLRLLDSRRQARAAEAAARERAERVRKVQEELRRTRVYAAVLLGATAIAVAGVFTAHKARNDAVAATATAEAVSGFLTEAVLRVDSGVFFKPSETSYEALLDRAALEVSTRLKSEPKAAADINLLLGRRYHEIGRFEAAVQQYEHAVAIYTRLYGEAAIPTLMALDRLALSYAEVGRGVETLALADRIRRAWRSQLEPTDLELLLVRLRTARFSLILEDLRKAETEVRAVIDEIPRAKPASPLARTLVKQWLGMDVPEVAVPRVLSAYANLLLAMNVLEEIGDEHREAERLLRDSLAVLVKTLERETELSALARLGLSLHLAVTGNFEESEELALQAGSFFDQAFPPGHFIRGLHKLGIARLRVEQHRFGEATSLLKEALDLCPTKSSCPERVRSEMLWEFAYLLSEADRGPEAIEGLQELVGDNERRRSPDHVLLLRIRVALANSLRQAGKFDEASRALSGLNPNAIARLSRYQQAKGDLRRVEGLLFLTAGKLELARTALQESLEVATRRHGPNHWRSKRAQAELSRVPVSAHIKAGS
jgi:DNA-binding winged helix-turn-helix (wHTH) protein/tetratricopeptide (TPR) repeat protein